MAPLRNRNARTTNEIDVLEGLPVRQWRQTEALIGPAQDQQPVLGKNAWPELPMPRDSHLLPEVSQQLLRAARAGRISKPPGAPPDDEDGKENAGEDDEHGTKEPSVKGFLTRKWSQVPRHLEEPEPEYLAKRRKGLPDVHSSWGGVAGPLAQTGAMRKTKVRRFDAEGNPHVYEVLAPKDQRLDGEILPEEEDQNAANGAPVEPTTTAAPGTVVEGVGVVNAEGVVVAHDLLQQPTPPRRKPPPPRKKKKPHGPGRGHKKKVNFEGEGEGATGMETPTSMSNLLGVPGGFNASDEANSSAVPSTTGDTPMPDAPDGDEEEESDEGEEGEIEEDDNDGREDGELSPSPSEKPVKDEKPPVTDANTTEPPQPDLLTEPLPSLQPPEEPLEAPLLPGLAEIQQPEPDNLAAPVQAVMDASRSSSPDPPLAGTTDSQQSLESAGGILPSTEEPAILPTTEPSEPPVLPGLDAASEPTNQEAAGAIPDMSSAAPPPEGDSDLFDSLEKHLESGGSGEEQKPAESGEQNG